MRSPPALPRHSIFAEWSAFNVAGLTAYRLFRAFGAGITPASVVVQVLPVGGNLATNRTDFEELADGQQYSYAAQALSGINDKSGLSIPAIVTAQNDAPVAVADNYDSGDIDIADGLVKGNLFDNDTDADIGPLGKANWTAADVTSTPNVFVPAEIDVPGLSFAGDPGAFTYDPSFGSVTFDYKVDTGTFTDGVNEVPMSPDSNTAMVTITLAYEVTIEDLKSRTNLGSAVSVTFQVRSSGGNIIADLSVVTDIRSVFNGEGPCGDGSDVGPTAQLYPPAAGDTGSSGLRVVKKSESFKFNWDTTDGTQGTGCYTVLITFDDGAPPRLTTAVELVESNKKK